MAEKRVVGYKETLAIQGFLTYLHSNVSRKINPKDTLLIAAVSAWISVESGSFSQIRYNNPFNLHGDPYTEVQVIGGRKRAVQRPGKLLRFATLAKGFIALAKVLMKAPKGDFLKVALNALKRGGNSGAVDFLAAIAMSSLDGGHYGAANFQEAYDPKENSLLGAYVKIGSVQLQSPKARTRTKAAPPPPPELPRDFQYREVAREYIDPWAAGRLYDGRKRAPVAYGGTKR